MKTFIFLSILFSAIAFPAFGALTDADLDKIRLIVNDSEKRIRQEFKTEIATLRQEFKGDIATLRQEIKEDITKSEKNIKEYVILQTGHIDKRLSTYNWVLYIALPLIIAALGIPTTIMAWRTGKDRSLEKQVEILTEEIETLKRQQIIQP